MPWVEGEHVLQLYPQAAAETGIGTAFVAEGLRQNASVVVIATGALWETLLRQLRAAGIDAQRAVAEDGLRLFGAHAILAAARPDETLRAILRFARAGNGGLRVVSELSDLLWRQGKQGAALAIERRWNAFARSEAFSLLCACGVDALDAARSSAWARCTPTSSRRTTAKPLTRRSARRWPRCSSRGCFAWCTPSRPRSGPRSTCPAASCFSSGSGSTCRVPRRKCSHVRGSVGGRTELGMNPASS